MYMSQSLLNSTEDSTDESEREDEEYEQMRTRYSALIQRALREAGPDLDNFPPSTSQGQAMAYQQSHHANGRDHQQRNAAWPAVHGSHDNAVDQDGQAGALRRLYFCGFGPTLSVTHILEFLAQFGPIEAFRLFLDPVTSHSLRAAGVLYQSAADATRALEAAADGMVYLNNIWAPEATLLADPTGEHAKRYYETNVRAPVPPLLAPPFDHRAISASGHFQPPGQQRPELRPALGNLLSAGSAPLQH